MVAEVLLPPNFKTRNITQPQQKAKTEGITVFTPRKKPKGIRGRSARMGNKEGFAEKAFALKAEAATKNIIPAGSGINEPKKRKMEAKIIDAATGGLGTLGSV